MAQHVNAVFQRRGKGIALVGALARVEKEDVEFVGVAGTSAGAIVAALFAAALSNPRTDSG
jgi:predicted acylesterase/phospholipase RssA